MDAETLDTVLGSGFKSRFVTEKELTEVKTNASKEAAGEPLRPLAEILREQKEAKQREWDQNMKLIKQGIYKPLEHDEINFLEQLEEERQNKAGTRLVGWQRPWGPERIGPADPCIAVRRSWRR